LKMRVLDKASMSHASIVIPE
jgi:hypothetical protein